MKCLVIGFGSIGQRHARMLSDMEHEVAVLSRVSNCSYPSHKDLSSAIQSFQPAYVVIANETGKHSQTLDTLAALKYQGITLVEKPLATSCDELRRIPDGTVYVGYTLRFHPVLQQVADFLRNQPLWSLTAYCGQYLPDWRPDRDYRQSYSANLDDGGVIRDLSHELDYVQWLAGDWQRTVAAGGHISSLEISSEDTVSILATCNRCQVVTIHLNYLDRNASRWIVANGPFGTLNADLVAGTMSINGNNRCFNLVRDTMIREQHLAAMSGRNDHATCSLGDARTTMEWIDALHLSLVEQRWVTRSSTSSEHKTQTL